MPLKLVMYILPAYPNLDYTRINFDSLSVIIKLNEFSMQTWYGLLNASHLKLEAVYKYQLNSSTFSNEVYSCVLF
jgi:hypothetical protein